MADGYSVSFFGASRSVHLGAMLRGAFEFDDGDAESENSSGRANSAYGGAYGQSRGRSKIDQYVEDEQRYEEAQRARAIERMALLSKPLAEPVRDRGGQRDECAVWASKRACANVCICVCVHV